MSGSGVEESDKKRNPESGYATVSRKKKVVESCTSTKFATLTTVAPFGLARH